MAGKSKTDELSDYDIAVYGYAFDFIKSDDWVNEIQDYWLCVHDAFTIGDIIIPTRLTIFDATLKVDFSFHPLAPLHRMIERQILPDDYNIGYEILLDKDELLCRLPKPSYKGFIIQKPTKQQYQKNEVEFWFEIYHTAKYLSRGDLWTAQFRSFAAKKWLLQMLTWHKTAQQAWNFSPKNDGKALQAWLEENVWRELHFCFGRFDAQDSRHALHHTISLYRKIAIETSRLLQYKYNEQLDQHLSQFIENLSI